MLSKAEIKQFVWARLIPKTRQVIEYQAGDDGTYQAGWWNNLPDNINKERFIEKIIDGDNIAIDLATGLVWPTLITQAGCYNSGYLNWSNAITYANNLTFAGFSDWRLPNIKELISLVNYSTGYPMIDNPPFTVKDEYYWTGTTLAWDTPKAHAVEFAGGQVWAQTKTGNQSMRCVRNLK